ncbi:hypothetical protein HOLleu_26788 [Holothuria leucospilota]|uniref:Uncharacterized protein n=1 Tax=Holothuria leucospilota TaxID=206669 RepID=A0A9Q1BP42_HOLLE|nr:hypothetical protein HOLleu_26788 [Holothuria leucospilota]
MSTRKKKEIEQLTASIFESLLPSPNLRELISSAVAEGVKSSLDKLTRTLEVMEGRIHQLECDLDDSAREVKKFQEVNADFQTKIAEANTKLNSLEQYSR